MTLRTDPTPRAFQLNAAEAETRIAANEAWIAGSRTFTTVAAAGATQGNATAIADAAVTVKVTVTASTEGVKLPTAVTGKRVEIFADPSVGVKVYPFLNDKIGSASTNTAVALAKNKSNIYQAFDAVTWRVVVGG